MALTNLTPGLNKGTMPGATVTFAYDVGSGQNRALIVLDGHLGYNGRAITGVTYNGVAMTAIFTPSTDGFDLGAYGMINPPTGSHNVVVSYSGSGADPYSLAAIGFEGAHQTTFWQNVTAKQTGFTNTPSRSVTSSVGAGNKVILMANSQSATSGTTSDTELVDSSQAAYALLYVSMKASAASSTTISSTLNDSNNIAAWAFELVAAAAADDPLNAQNRGLRRGIRRGLSSAMTMVQDGLLWRPKEQRLIVPVAISLAGA